MLREGFSYVQAMVPWIQVNLKSAIIHFNCIMMVVIVFGLAFILFTALTHIDTEKDIDRS